MHHKYAQTISSLLFNIQTTMSIPSATTCKIYNQTMDPIANTLHRISVVYKFIEFSHRQGITSDGSMNQTINGNNITHG